MQRVDPGSFRIPIAAERLTARPSRLTARASVSIVYIPQTNVSTIRKWGSADYRGNFFGSNSA